MRYAPVSIVVCQTAIELYIKKKFLKLMQKQKVIFTLYQSSIITDQYMKTFIKETLPSEALDSWAIATASGKIRIDR